MILFYFSVNSSLKQTIYYQDILENDLILAKLNENGRENASSDNSIPQVDVKIRCKYASNLADESESESNVTDCFHFTDVIVSLQKSRKWLVFKLVTVFSQVNHSLVGRISAKYTLSHSQPSQK